MSKNNQSNILIKEKIDLEASKKISKLLSLILRHKPEVIKIELDNKGWCNVDELLRNIKIYKNVHLTLEKLIYIVENNNKKRFTFDENRKKIRANQGHSLEVELDLDELIPPKNLYHGTAVKNLEGICYSGVKKQDRHHVHMSIDVKTAGEVGSRHGKPVIIKVDSKKMYNDGIKFYKSKNQVWLTEFVDKKYIEIIRSSDYIENLINLYLYILKKREFFQKDSIEKLEIFFKYLYLEIDKVEEDKLSFELLKKIIKNWLENQSFKIETYKVDSYATSYSKENSKLAVLNNINYQIKETEEIKEMIKEKKTKGEKIKTKGENYWYNLNLSDYLENALSGMIDHLSEKGKEKIEWDSIIMFLALGRIYE